MTNSKMLNSHVDADNTNDASTTGLDTLVLNVAEYTQAPGVSDARFTVYVDGVALGTYQVTAQQGAGTQDIVINGNFGAGSHAVQIKELPPTHPGTTTAPVILDVYSASIDGNTVNQSVQLSNKGSTTYMVQNNGYQQDSLILTMAEDAFKGDAEFTVSVNGVQQGGIYTVTASHALGQSQQFLIDGDFGMGGDVSIDFVNPNGTAKTGQRALYVDSIDLDGSTLTPDAKLTTSTTQNNYVSPVGTTLLTLDVSTNPSGLAQEFSVSVNGKALPGVFTAGGPQANGQSQIFTFEGDWQSADKVTITEIQQPNTSEIPLIVNSIGYDTATYLPNNENVTQENAAVIGSQTFTIKAMDHTAEANQNLKLVNGNADNSGPTGTLTVDGTPQNLWFQQSGNDLVIDVLGSGTAPAATIRNWYADSTTHWQQTNEIFGGNYETVATGLQSLVQAMASFSAANPAFNPLTTTHVTLEDTYYLGPSMNNALGQAINAAWGAKQ